MIHTYILSIPVHTVYKVMESLIDLYLQNLLELYKERMFSTVLYMYCVCSTVQYSTLRHPQFSRYSEIRDQLTVTASGNGLNFILLF